MRVKSLSSKSDSTGYPAHDKLDIALFNWMDLYSFVNKTIVTSK